MQFLLSKYSDHGSKFSSIFETAKGPECKIRKSPYTYYNNLAKNLEPLKVVYIYISPQQFFDNGSDPGQCWEAKGVEMFGPDWLQEEQKALSLFETVKLSPHESHTFPTFICVVFFLCCNVFFVAIKISNVYLFHCNRCNHNIIITT